MLFNSIAFLVFLVLSVPLYYVLPPAWRKYALLGLSYAFYAYWSIPYLALLVLATAVAYIFGIRIEAAKTEAGRKKVLVLSLLFLLASLVLFKYAGVLAALARAGGLSDQADIFSRLIVPLGISYYTFKLISYVIDIYWGKIEAEKDLVAFALYPAFFPQILSGPIQRPGDFLPQVKRPIPNDPARIVSGLRLMLFGYFKKIVIADSLALVVNQVYANPSSYNSLSVLLAGYAFVFQLYADFSGFTDIAIGTGRVFGIQSPPNFNLPFASGNIQVFWRNWHITLTRWLADYVFMPLRMSLRAWGTVGLGLAITVNFVAIGIWHGASLPFLAFGLLHAFYMCVSIFTMPPRDAFFNQYPRLQKMRRLWAPIITFQLWTVSQVLFRVDSLAQARNLLKSVLAFDFAKPWAPVFYERTFFMVVLCICVMEVVHWAQAKGRLADLFYSKPIVVRWTGYYALMLICLFFLKQGSQQFIYFKF